MKNRDVVCPMTNDPCRFCSDTIIIEVVRFGIIRDCEYGKAGNMGRKTRVVNLGEFCNNDGRHFVRDMKYCPAKWALNGPGKVPSYSHPKLPPLPKRKVR